MEQRQIINWGIVVLAALVVTVLQVVGGPVLWVMGLVLRIAILAALGWFMYTLWRNNRSRLQWLSRRQKLLFYGAAALLAALDDASFVVVNEDAMSRYPITRWRALHLASRRAGTRAGVACAVAG